MSDAAGLKVRADLGCLQGEEILPGGMHRGGAVTVRQTFACTPIAVEVPTQGVRREEVPCPVCGRAVQLTLASPERVQMLVMAALLFAAAVVAGLGMVMGFADDKSGGMRQISYIVYGVAGLIALAAGVVAFVRPALMVATGEVVSVADGTGHKLMNVRAKG